MATLIRTPRVSNSTYLLTEKGKKQEKEKQPDDASGLQTETEVIDHTNTVLRSKLFATSMSPENSSIDNNDDVLEQKLVDLEFELAQLKKNMAAEIEQAKNQAIRDGFELGISSGKEKVGDQADKLGKVIKALQTQVEETASNQEDLFVEIVFAAVGKIIGQVASNEEAILAAVRESTRKVLDCENLTVRVGPEDYQLLMDNQQKLFGGSSAEKVKLVSDEQVRFGGCILETDNGSLDNRLEIQLQILKETLVTVRQRTQ